MRIHPEASRPVGQRVGFDHQVEARVRHRYCTYLQFTTLTRSPAQIDPRAESDAARGRRAAQVLQVE